MYSTVQNAVYNEDYGHLKSLDLERESKTFRLRGPGLGIQVFGLAIDHIDAYWPGERERLFIVRAGSSSLPSIPFPSHVNHQCQTP